MSATLALPSLARSVARTGRGRHIGFALTCLVVMAVMLFPLVATFVSSIKTSAEASAVPPVYLPSALSLENYAKVFGYQAGLGTYLFNSLAVAFLTIVLCLVLAVPAGYALARLRVPMRETVFLVLLSGMMVPYQALLTPLYLMFASIGLTNTHLGLAIVHTVLQLPFSVYVMRNSFEAVPRDLEEAALIDGCSSFQILWRILLPLARPALVTVVLFAFVMSWNEFIGALILMGKETRFTVPIMLVGVRQGHFGAVDWGALQAGIVVSILPCLAIYLLLHKHYVAGFLSGAIK
ncbi:MAG TPA: carbohydrate ABC transporter permease [Burkholderiaceae bacterium]|nr:carbohydrate ABC transporter permease [Burkholderiaceae bacterium]